ncbi:XdhC family protein [soil metagenome]
MKLWGRFREADAGFASFSPNEKRCWGKAPYVSSPSTRRHHNPKQVGQDSLREAEDLVRAWRALPAGAEAVLATVVVVRGSVYRRPGARMLLVAGNHIAGSVSGGCLESDLAETAWTRTAEGPVRVAYDSTAPDDALYGFGLGCNGVSEVLLQRLPPDGGPLAVLERVIRERHPAMLATVITPGSRLGEWWTPLLTHESRTHIAICEGVEILVESLVPPPSLVVFGAGHDAAPLVRIAKEVGWRVTVIDHRPVFAEASRLPEADEVMVATPRKAQESIAIEPGSAVVLMTHSYRHDLELLGWLLKSPAAYVGQLGPLLRTERLLRDLDFVPTEAERGLLHAPIGHDLGAESPDEIALAIVAEIQAFFAGRAGGSLNGRREPLHPFPI